MNFVFARAPMESPAASWGLARWMFVAESPTLICANPRATVVVSFVTGPALAIEYHLLSLVDLTYGFDAWLKTSALR